MLLAKFVSAPETVSGSNRLLSSVGSYVRLAYLNELPSKIWALITTCDRTACNPWVLKIHNLQVDSHVHLVDHRQIHDIALQKKILEAKRWSAVKAKIMHKEVWSDELTWTRSYEILTAAWHIFDIVEGKLVNFERVGIRLGAKSKYAYRLISCIDVLMKT